MVPGLDIITTSAWLIMASAPGLCHFDTAPRIEINPVSAPIAYEYNMSAAELGRIKNNTVNPYSPGTDTVTGGLRHDKPHMEYTVSLRKHIDPQAQTVCYAYGEIKIDITLSPKIYIANDKTFRQCRDAIIEHELKHVETDRKVINNYANRMGQAVLQAVNEAGAVGPYNLVQADDVEKNMQGHIKNVIEAHRLWLHKEMSQQQALIDTLEEYERIGSLCRTR